MCFIDINILQVARFYLLLFLPSAFVTDRSFWSGNDDHCVLQPSAGNIKSCVRLIDVEAIACTIITNRRITFSWELTGLSSTTSPPATLARSQVASRRRTKLVHSVPPGPDGTLALDNADELLSQSLRESVASTAPALLLFQNQKLLFQTFSCL